VATQAHAVFLAIAVPNLSSDRVRGVPPPNLLIATREVRYERANVYDCSIVGDLSRETSERAAINTMNWSATQAAKAND
jgi:hypothetical protein